MGIFERENEVFQNRNYREHLNRNWDAGNDALDMMTKRLAKTGEQNADEVALARVDIHGKDFNSLGGRIDDTQGTAETAYNLALQKADKSDLEARLAQITSVPGTFANSEALKAKYPNGAEGIFVTIDTGHKWIYSNGAWTDFGVYQAAGIDPDIKNKINLALGYLNKNNLIQNANLASNDLSDWNYVGDAGSFVIDWNNTVNNTPSLKLSVSGKTKDAWFNYKSQPFPVTPGQEVYHRFYIKTEDIDVGKPAIISLVFYKDLAMTQQVSSTDGFSSDKSISDFRAISFKTTVPDGAVVACFKVSLQRNGTLWICRPQAALNGEFEPFSMDDVEEFAKLQAFKLSGNRTIADNNSLFDWNILSPDVTTIDEFTKFGGFASVCMSSTTQQTNAYYVTKSQEVDVEDYTVVSARVASQFYPVDSTDLAAVQLVFKDSAGKETAQTIVQYFTKTEFAYYELKNIPIPSGTKKVYVKYILNKNGSLWFQYPEVFFDEETAFKDLIEAKKHDAFAGQNILRGYEITTNNISYYWGRYVSDTSGIDTETTFEGKPTLKISNTGNENDIWNYWQLTHDWRSQAKKITLSVFAKASGMDDPSNAISVNYGYVSLVFLDANGERLLTLSSRNIYDEKNFTEIKMQAIDVPENTAKIQIRLCSRRNGTINYSEPHLYLGEFKPIESIAKIEDAINENSIKLPKVFLNGDYNTMTGDDYKQMTFLFKDGKRTIAGFANVKWQGDSSRAYPKKNLKLKLYEDEGLSNKLKIVPKTGWKKQNTFVLKANWIDATQARNVVNSELWYELTVNRPTITKNPNNYFVGSQREVSVVGSNVVHQVAPLYSIDKNVVGKNVTLSLDLNSTGTTGNYTVWIKSSASHKTIGAGTFNGEAQHLSKAFTLDDSVDTNLPIVLQLVLDNVPTTDTVTVSNAVCSTTVGDNLENPVDSIEKLLNAPYAGAIQGFPVEVYINGSDYGLYTFNTTHEDTLWNMDDKVLTNAAIGGNGTNAQYNTDSTVISDDGDYALEVPKKLSDDISNSFNGLLKFINSSSDEDFKAHAFDHFDVMAAIDTYLVNSYFAMYDASAKSLYMLTYNSGKWWIPCMYDMDSTWGLAWNGSKIEYANATTWQAGPNTNTFLNKFQERVRDNFDDLVKERWKYLRTRTFAPDYIMNKFKNFMESIGVDGYNNNLDVWPNTPTQDDNNLQQIQTFVSIRFAYLDSMLNI